MKNIIAVLIFTLLILLLGFFIGKSCSDKEVIVKTDFDSTIAHIDANIKRITATQDSILEQRILHQTFNKYEITKIDSLIAIDSAWVNAIIRARIERLNKLSGFFQITSDTGRASYYPNDSTGW